MTDSPRKIISKQPDRLTDGLHSRGALPHLKQEGASYFVTFRLTGTLPREVLLRLKQERESLLRQAETANRPLTWHEQKELFHWYAERVDAYLDAGNGDCWLRRPEVASLVAGAVRHFEGQRYRLFAWVVMPNHVHAVVRPEPPHTLSEILKSWKGYTAVQANRMLGREGNSFWQSESYDHCCRDEEDRARCCAYTVMNPVTARLCARPEDWPWSSAHVGQVSDLPVRGVSDSANVVARGGLRRRPEPSGQRPDPQADPRL
jgi:REP element-mobilizing transposase RayT